MLRFLGGVGAGTEVDGFQIQGGGGMVFSGIPYFARYGAGIMINATSPTLRNLVVSGNSAGSPPPSWAAAAASCSTTRVRCWRT